MTLEIDNNDIENDIADSSASQTVDRSPSQMLDTASQMLDSASQMLDMDSIDTNNPVKSSTELDALIRASLTGPVKSSAEMDALIRASLTGPVKSSAELDALIRASLTGPVKSSAEMDALIRASLSTVTRLHRLTSLGTIRVSSSFSFG